MVTCPWNLHGTDPFWKKRKSLWYKLIAGLYKRERIYLLKRCEKIKSRKSTFPGQKSKSELSCFSPNWLELIYVLNMNTGTWKFQNSSSIFSTCAWGQKWNKNKNRAGVLAFHICFHQLKMNPKWKTTYLNPESFPMSVPSPPIYTSQSIYILILVWWEEVRTQSKKNLSSVLKLCCY